MSKNTFGHRVYKFLLHNQDQRFTVKEIAEALIEADPEWVREKTRNSKNSELLSDEKQFRHQITAEIHSWRVTLEEKYGVRVTADRPKKMFVTEKSEEQEIEDASAEQLSATTKLTSDKRTEPAFSEQELYPILGEYLASSLEIFSKRIDEKVSSNSRGPNGNKWLHPDVIGVQVLSENWSKTVRQLVSNRNEPRTLMYSFEVKKVVNTSNVREVFFQTVSNSSWANFGYLVAAEISNEKALDELRVLSNQHGIGVMVLDREEPAESQILIQADKRSEIDWSAVNRLAVENRDAKKVLEYITYYYQTDNPQSEFWDNGPNRKHD